MQAKAMTIKSHRDLRVWQEAMDLVQETYALTRTFPSHERYGLAAQMQRAAVSVPSNIAEGKARQHLKEYLNHLSIAQASLAELDTQVEIADRLGYVSAADAGQTQTRLEVLGKRLRRLRASLSGHQRQSDT